VKPHYSIAVVGAGSAGPAAALLLERQGHQVQIFERAPFNEPIGAGFMLQPSGISILKYLDLWDELEKHIAKIANLYCQTTSEKVLMNLRYEELEHEWFGAGTHRSTLLNVLLDACSDAGIYVHWDREITATKTVGNQRVLVNGSEELGAFDLVIFCDGARSTLRDQLGIPVYQSTYPWGALWCMKPITDEFDSTTLWQAVQNTNILTGFLPTGTKHNLLSLFWSIRMNKVHKWQETPLDEWKADVLNSAPQAGPYLDQITSHDDLAVASYQDVVMPHWHAQNAIVIGDAAHALSPQLGQGVNLALMDAATLSDCIETHSTLDDALAKYSELRKRHLGFYQYATRMLTPFFQSDYITLGMLRDLTFPIVTKVPWVRKQMTASMCGVKDGIFSRLKLDCFR